MSTGTGQVQSHEALVAEFGAWASEIGFAPSTDVHPRDLVLWRDGHEWLVEAKIVYVGNATRAVREATVQLQMYRFLLYEGTLPKLLAVFSEEVGEAYVAFLESLQIGAAWRDDDRWSFSPSASELTHG